MHAVPRNPVQFGAPLGNDAPSKTERALATSLWRHNHQGTRHNRKLLLTLYNHPRSLKVPTIIIKRRFDRSGYQCAQKKRYMALA